MHLTSNRVPSSNSISILHTHSDLPLAGLSVARQIAMVSYRTAKGYHGKFGRAKDASGVFKARSYLAYQVRSASALFSPSLRSLSFSSSSPHCLSSFFLSVPSSLPLPFLFLHRLSYLLFTDPICSHDCNSSSAHLFESMECPSNRSCSHMI